MTDPLAYGAQLLWAVANRRAHRDFGCAIDHPDAAQLAVLRRLLERNRGCEFGKRHDFSRINSFADFSAAVPIRDYAAMEDDIARLIRGEQGVLTTEPVLMFEKTGGSTAAAKYIPYTASLRREFGDAIAAWMYDLHASRPGLRRGKAYWSITPAVRRREITPGGLPVGFESDADYLGPVERRLMSAIMATGPEIARAENLDQALHLTASRLRATRSLKFISVWNPSFLTLLCDRLSPDSPASLWPELEVISCWADASASLALPALRSRFPGVEIQPKGLLSTEGVVTIPMCGVAGGVPALNSHFLEFLPDGDSSSPRLIHELAEGVEYTVVMSTGGGLWRYRTGDRVKVCARIGRTPTLVFLGREGGVSDLCGEKLSEGFVAGVFSRILLPALRPGAFAILAPDEGGPPSYSLFTDDVNAHGLDVVLDAALRDNPHFDYCRNLGQLGPIRIRIVRGDAVAAMLRHAERGGRRAGDVKPAALYPKPGLVDAFVGMLS